MLQPARCRRHALCHDPGRQRDCLFEPVCEAMAPNVPCSNPHNVFGTLWAMTEAGTARPAIFEALCEATVNRVQCYNPHNVADTL